MIEITTVTVAQCDACGTREYADEEGVLSRGLSIAITRHADGTNYLLYTCRESHIGKAARAVLNRAPDEHEHEDEDDEPGTGPVLDAPPLPHDTEAAFS